MTAIRRITHKTGYRRLIMGVAVGVLALLARPAAAQYMYLDSNGDGVHDANDRMNKSAPTPVDVWLDTDSNRDGSAGVCDFGSGALDMSHYEFVLHAVGGTVTWGPLTNLITPFTLDLTRDSRDTSGPTYYHNGWG